MRAAGAIVRLALAALLTLSTACPATAFSLIKDYSSRDESFTALVNGVGHIPYEIRRVLVEPPYHNGLPGFNALIIRRYKEPVDNGPEEVMTTLIRGHIRLAGFHESAQQVLAFLFAQRGEYLMLIGLRAYGPDRPEGMAIGPSGTYQYGSISPDGSHCLLVGQTLTMLEIESGQFRIIPVSPPLSGKEADPPGSMPGGFNIGYSADITGRHLEMIWDGPQRGRLIARNKSGEITRIIKVLP